ncbi:hypothetical protein Clacol_001701 [Clathrus columnatus]|uniref:adenine phosphoribosyltransferase n=1 Tax=Clathrus columnatus TaxID=1419009 RepID=A0AAV4ZYU0_9AGAM|nr:hypothetical protein Clacol_001701 [Clathrus columnatus]
MDSDVAYIKGLLGVHPDWPKKGITFLDVFPILQDPLAFECLITHLIHHITSYTIPKLAEKKIDVVVGLDARGFLFGPIIALRLGAAFVPVRKKGKLPGTCTTAEYIKEYGTDTFEMQSGSIKPQSTVIVIDDLIATALQVGEHYITIGGSAKAAGELVRAQEGKTVEYIFIIGLPFLKGGEKLDAPIYTMIEADD